MLSALLAVLALAGAPATTTVDCNPALPLAGGLTVSDQATIVDGKVVPGPLNHIYLGGYACGALLYASVSPSERLRIRKLNPGLDWDRFIGVGLQVALHESEHVAMNSPDECQVEKVTRGKVNDLIARMGEPKRVAAEEAAATASDALLPAQYHGC